MDPADRRREDERLAQERERDRIERDRIERLRLHHERLDALWKEHVADRAAADDAETERLDRRGEDDRARIRREEAARSSGAARLQVWPESGTALPSSVEVVDPLDLTTYRGIDFRHPTIDDLAATVVGRFHPADGGDLALTWPSVTATPRVVRREQVPDAWTWVSVDGTPYPLAIRREAGLVLLSWQDPALHPGRRT